MEVSMRKFRDWFELNRQTIGYTVGGFNLLNGLLMISTSPVVAVFWLVLGAAIIFDSKMFK